MTTDTPTTRTWIWNPTRGHQTRSDMWSPTTDGVGLGVFETLRTHNGQLVMIDAHMDRLVRALKQLHWLGNINIAAFRQTVIALIDESNIPQSPRRVRISVNPDGTEPDSLVIRVTTGPLVIHTAPATAWLSPYIRNPQSPLSGLKTSSFGENIVALSQATAAGFDEAIFTDRQGNPVEGALSNIFFVQGDILVTPPLTSGCLAGITRSVTIERARSIGIQVVERVVSLDELSLVHEIFLTATTRLQQPVQRIVSGNLDDAATLWTATTLDNVAGRLRAVN